MQVKLIHRGAEAEIYITEVFGRKAILKKRTPKTYRCETLDKRIRIERSRSEALLIHRAKLVGVRTPTLLEVCTEKAEICMEYVAGRRLKDALVCSPKAMRIRFCRRFGDYIAKLHNANIIHGDLTTSNVIVQRDAHLVLLDFGLGFHSHKVEDKATDLLNLKKSFLATHARLKNEWKALLQRYKVKCNDAAEVLKKMVEIEQRARYY